MEKILSIAQSLGFDSSLPIHLICFAVSYLSLRYLIFEPYSKALEQRRQRTLGQEAAAAKTLGEVSGLQEKFESRAKELNTKLSTIFETTKKAASIEAENVLKSARDKAETQLEATRSTLEKEVNTVRGQLAKDVPVVAAAIASKLSGKEMSV